MIKFLDLAAQNHEIAAEVDRELSRIHHHTSYIDGPQVAAFEQEFANYLGARRVVGVGSGTDALRLSLLALGIGPGDEVLTVPMTFIATAEAIIQTGAVPVLIEIDPETGTMSPQELRKYLEARNWKSPNGPRAILPVHLYGLPAAMNDICEIASAYRIPVVEDACQAHGARVREPGRWRMAGAIGRLGCFSFYPGKNLGAWGEAGAVATNDEALAEKILRLRNHGRISHYAHADCGYNARLDTIQAAVLGVKLKRLAKWTERRREIAAAYSALFRALEVDTQLEPVGYESCYHLFVIRSRQRDAIRQALLTNEIECGIHYPIPLHRQPALLPLGYHAGDFPVSERWAETVLSLPMHSHMSNAEVVDIVNTIAAVIGHKNHAFAGEPMVSSAANVPRRAAE